MAKDYSDELMTQLQGEREGDVLRAMLEVMCQQVMEAELARHVGADRHERTQGRSGHRNGYKPRTLKTRVRVLIMSSGAFHDDSDRTMARSYQVESQRSR